LCPVEPAPVRRAPTGRSALVVGGRLARRKEDFAGEESREQARDDNPLVHQTQAYKAARATIENRTPGRSRGSPSLLVRAGGQRPMERVRTIWKKILPFVAAAVALGAVGTTAARHLSDGSCCKAGAACCYPGSPCCKGAAHDRVSQL